MFTKTRDRIRHHYRTNREVYILNTGILIGGFTAIGTFMLVTNGKILIDPDLTWFPDHVIRAVENNTNSVLYALDDGPDLLLKAIPEATS